MLRISVKLQRLLAYNEPQSMRPMCRIEYVEF